MAPIRVSTNGIRDVTAETMSQFHLGAAGSREPRDRPVRVRRCSRSSLLLEACRYSGAVLRTDRERAVGPAGRMTADHPAAVDERPARRGHQRHVRNPGGRQRSDQSSARRSPGAHVRDRHDQTVVEVAREIVAQQVIPGGPTRSAEHPVIRAAEFDPQEGVPRSTSPAMIAAPIGMDRRMTTLVERYQNNRSTGWRPGRAGQRLRRSQRRMSQASSRLPSTTMAAV